MYDQKDIIFRQLQVFIEVFRPQTVLGAPSLVFSSPARAYSLKRSPSATLSVAAARRTNPTRSLVETLANDRLERTLAPVRLEGRPRATRSKLRLTPGEPQRLEIHLIIFIQRPSSLTTSFSLSFVSSSGSSRTQGIQSRPRRCFSIQRISSMSRVRWWRGSRNPWGSRGNRM